MDLYFLCSILAVNIVIMYCFICWITKVRLRLHNSAIIAGMLLIMLLGHVEIHICYLKCFWILCALGLKAVTALDTNICSTWLEFFYPFSFLPFYAF
jgi:hypothetical protein